MNRHISKSYTMTKNTIHLQHIYLYGFIFKFWYRSRSNEDSPICSFIKTNDLPLFTNFRPVSVLPAFSKILERIVYNRLINFLNKCNILSNNQYGFRKDCSTTYALIQLYENLLDAIDQEKVSLGLFIDLSKAFDTVNHDILLAKL